MRPCIIEDIINNLNYRDKNGIPNYTMVSGFLFNDEITYIIETLKLGVKKLTTTYNQIIFYSNFKK